MMKCATLAAAAILAMSGPASAGVYLGLGMGARPMVNDATESVGAPSSRSLRGIAGARFANVSLEGALNGFDLATRRGGSQTLYQASASLKLSLPIAGPLEGFGRAGLERTWLNMDDDRYDLEGDGFLAGAGLEVRMDLLVASMSVFADYTVHHVNLESTIDKVASTSQVVSVGVLVGI